MKLTIIHNIPSPYRLHLFEVLDSQLRALGGGAEVHFMADGHADRPGSWRRQLDDFKVPYRVWPDYGPNIRGRRFHWNPGLVAEIIARPPQNLLVGGPWDSLTTLHLATAIGKMNAFAWYEGNTQTPGKIVGALGALKRAILRRYKLLLVPGADGARYTKMLFKDRVAQEIALLPNIVDERRFVPSERARAAGAERLKKLGVFGGRIAIWPARCIPAKGILEYIHLLRNVKLGAWKIVIVGEGPLFTAVGELIRGAGLERSIIQCKYVEYAAMPELYAASDLFLLPSLHDPNPLSVVEAMHSGLPILVSNRIGNYTESIEGGGNGWSFDPASAVQTVQASEMAFNSPIEALRALGGASVKRARRFWSSETAVSNCLSAIQRAKSTPCAYHIKC